MGRMLTTLLTKTASLKQKSLEKKALNFGSAMLQATKGLKAIGGTGAGASGWARPAMTAGIGAGVGAGGAALTGGDPLTGAIGGAALGGGAVMGARALHPHMLQAAGKMLRAEKGVAQSGLAAVAPAAKPPVDISKLTGQHAINAAKNPAQKVEDRTARRFAEAKARNTPQALPKVPTINEAPAAQAMPAPEAAGIESKMGSVKLAAVRALLTKKASKKVSMSQLLNKTAAVLLSKKNVA